MKYDIGLVCVFNNNYGNSITNFALYYYLKSQGYKVLLIKQSLKSFWTDLKGGYFHLYRNVPFDATFIDERKVNKKDYYSLNELCNVFLVGSDQLWSLGFVSGCDYYTCLDWVVSKRPKIAYGTSFGIEYFEGNDEETKKLGDLLHRFEAIGIREIEGKHYLKEKWNIQSKHVCDPVFLLSADDYRMLAKNSVLNIAEGFVGAYILDQTFSKDNIVKNVMSEIACSNVMLVGDAMKLSKPEEDCFIHAMNNVCVEDLIYLIDKCDFFVTDSFHGMCLALIFNKEFVVIANRGNKRGYPRMYSLLDRLNLLNRIVTDKDASLAAQLARKRINYECVNDLLFGWIDECKQELLRTVAIKEATYDEEYDNKLQNMMADEEKRFAFKVQRIKQKWRRYIADHEITNERPPIIWGCGNMFRINGFEFQEALSIENVVDSNSELWGSTILDTFKCISPDELGEKSVVIVMVENPNVYKTIFEELEVLGIENAILFSELL